MRINFRSNSAPSMKAGLYFSKTSNVLFNQNPNINYVTNEVVKISKEGSRYIEDTTIPQVIKKYFAEIPFIKELAQKFDTFIHFCKVPKGGRFNKSEFVAYAKISWADYSKKYAEQKDFIGTSTVSQEAALYDLFRQLENAKIAKKLN